MKQDGRSKKIAKCLKCGRSLKCYWSTICISCNSKLNWKNDKFRNKVIRKLKGRVFSAKHKENLKEALKTSEHHLDLDKSNNKKSNKLILTNQEHQSLHRQAYRYIVKVLGIKELNNYIKWWKNEKKIK